MSVPNRADNSKRRAVFKPLTARASSLNIEQRPVVAVDSAGVAQRAVQNVLHPGPKYGDPDKAEYDQIQYRNK